MKFLNVFFLAAGLFLMSSCGGDDPTPEELIVGSWDVSSFITSDCTDSDDDESFVFGDASCVVDNGQNVCLTSTAIFTAPSTLVFTQYQTVDGVVSDSLAQNGTYSFAENGEMTICFDGECDPGTLTVSETSMVWTGNTDSEGCTTTVTGSM